MANSTLGAPLRKVTRKVSNKSVPTSKFGEERYGKNRLTLREIREEIRRRAVVTQKEAISEKLRDANRRQKRAVKYQNRFEEQSGYLSDGGSIWPFRARGFETRAEAIRAEVEVRKIRALGVIQEQAGIVANAGKVLSFAANAITGSGVANVMETMKVTADSVREVGQAASSIESCIVKIQKMFEDMYASFMKYVPLALGGAILIAFAFWMGGSDRMPSFLWSAICLVVAQILGHEAYKQVAVYFEQKPVIEEQSGFVSQGVIGAIIAFLMHKSIGNAFSSPSAYWFSILMKDIGSAPRTHDGLKGLFEWVVVAVEKTINHIRGFFELGPIRLVEKYGEEIDRLVLEVASLSKSEMTIRNTGENAEARLNKITSLIATVWNFKNLYRGNRDITRELEVLNLTLTRLAAPLRAAVGGTCGYTQLPVSVCLFGEAGVGKTMMVQNLVTTVLKHVGYINEEVTEDEASKLIFLKPFNSEYMDGYYGQPVYLLDDLMMKKATPADTSNGLLDLLTYYSAFTNIVNKAACDDKGMEPFSSKIIMMTTNMRHLDQANASQCFLHLPALNRRVDIHYEVCVKPEYRKPGTTQLDYNKFEIEWNKCMMGNKTACESYPWYIWEVFPTSWDGSHADNTPGTGQSFWIIIREMARLLRERKDSHLNALKAAKHILVAPLTDDSELDRLAGVQQQAPEIGDLDDPDVLLAAMPERRVFKSAWTDCYSHTFDELEVISEGSETDFDEEFEASGLSRWQFARRRLRNAFNHFAELAKNFFEQYGLLTLAIAGLASGFAIILYRSAQMVWEYLRSLFYGGDSCGIEEQSNRPTSAAITYRKLQQQSGQFHEGNHRLVYNNSFKLGVHTTAGKTIILGQVTYLEMDYMVMPLHFDTNIRKALDKGELTRESEMFLRACRSAEQCIKLKVGHFLDFPRSTSDFRDLCFVRTVNLHTAKKITGFVVSESDLKDVGGLPVRLDTARVEADGKLVDYNDRIAFLSKSVEVGTHGVTIGTTRHRNWLSYAADTILGDCGAPLCLQKSQRFQHRVWLGFHVGLKVGFGQAYATQLTAELVARHLDDLKRSTRDPRVSEATFQETVEQAGLHIPAGFDVVDSDHMPFKADGSDEDQLDFGSFSGLGELTRVVSAPIKTNLTTTFVYEDDMLEDIMPEFTLTPMRLAPHMIGDIVSYPTVNALKPYAGDVISIDLDLVRTAIPMAMKRFSDATVNVSGRLWSLSEALVGANGAKGIPLGTSVGLPGCIDHRNKRAMLGGGLEWDLEKPEVKEFLDEVSGLEALCLKGIRPFFMARGFLKDELRKPGKGARYIAGTNVHYYVLCRRYFGQIVSTQMNQFQDSGMCPGINPYQDWEWLQNFVTKHGDKVWDGDFSGFDTSQQPQLLGECLNFINSWYTARGCDASDNAVRVILFQDLMKSRHAVGKGVVATHVVQWQRSLPSGHFLTTFINSMLSMVCIVAAFVKTTGRLDFWDCASVASLGDDNLVGVADELVNEFNQVTVASVLKEEFGMTYTAGRKGEELKPYLSIEEVSFLQRVFRVKDNIVVGPIRKESIFGSLLYTKKGDVKYRREVMCQNIEGALSELSLWPEEDWSASIGAILRVSRRLEYTPRLMVDSSQDYFKFTCSRTDLGWF